MKGELNLAVVSEGRGKGEMACATPVQMQNSAVPQNSHFKISHLTPAREQLQQEEKEQK